MILALVEQAQQHVERLARGSRDVVEDSHLARKQGARPHVAADDLAIVAGLLASDDGISDDQAGADTESGATPSDDPADTLVFTATQVLSGDDDADQGAPKTAMLFKQGKKLISQVTSHQQTDISVFECTVIKNTAP